MKQAHPKWICTGKYALKWLLLFSLKNYIILGLVFLLKVDSLLGLGLSLGTSITTGVKQTVEEWPASLAKGSPQH